MADSKADTPVTLEVFNAAFQQLDARLDAYEAKLDARLDAYDAKLDARLEPLATREDLAKLEERVNDRLQSMKIRTDALMAVGTTGAVSHESARDNRLQRDPRSVNANRINDAIEIPIWLR